MHATIQNHIKKSWDILRRSPLDVAPDPKVDEKTAFLYAPPGESLDDIRQRIAARKQETNDPTPIDVRTLPTAPQDLKEHGVLYLPHDYVVPGGRFNEMYGWDSYWIVRGLILDKRSALAKGMVKNFLYEIENYGGKILNANRTYYLSRSQPPLLSPMVLDVAGTLEGAERRAFLTRATAALATNYKDFWQAQRRTEATGLFRYGHPDQGELGLCPEVVFGERDAANQSHYDIIAAHLRSLPSDDPLRQRFYDDATQSLTREAIAGDRGMRESGFDPSMHMGYYGLETLDINPVCLNTLLYVQCRDLAVMNAELGRADQAEAWGEEANRLKTSIQTLLWNDEAGLFADYNHAKGKTTDFPFLTAAYPLWAGIATREQAERFRKNLGLFETEYGLQTTPIVTGCQWDGPYMWAPLVYFATEGLRRYRHDADALRLARKFTDTVTRVFDEHGTIYEKFNALTGKHNTDGVEVGYRENVTGFGWTNGTAAYVWNWMPTLLNTHDFHEEARRTALPVIRETPPADKAAGKPSALAKNLPG